MTAEAEVRMGAQGRVSGDDLIRKYGFAFVFNSCFMSSKYNYLYVANFRCGSTSIRHALIQLEKFENVASGNRVGNARRVARDALEKVFDGDGKAVQVRLDNPNLFWFSMVRHPVTRLASAYASKVVDPHGQEVPVRRWFVDNGIEIGEQITFDQFLTYLEHSDLRRVNKHWRMQKDILMHDEVRYDFVGRMENYDEDMTFVLKRLGADVSELPMKNVGRTTDSVIGDLSSEQIDRIYKLFQADFDIFKYPRLPA